MASKEHQGLQIAVMIFFMLTVALGVTTFFGFSSASQERVKVKTEQENAANSRSALDKTQNDYNTLKKYVGLDIKNEMAQIKPEYEKDMKGQGLAPIDEAAPDGDKKGGNYRDLVDQLSSNLKSTSASLAKANESNRELEKRAAEEKEAADKKVAEHDQARADAIAEREAVEASIKKQLAAAQKAYNDAKGIGDKSNAALTAAKAKAEKEVARLTALNRDLANINEGLKGKLEEVIKEELEVPDGKITFVNQRADIVYINVGQQDGLRGRVTFSVWAPEDANVEKAKPKGSIEVIGIPEANSAEARILQHELSNPILPGDLIYSPVWNRGQPVRFALAGLIDIDGDKKSDLQKVRDLVRLSGGLIDAEVDESGKIVGTMSVQTRYLVVGDTPTEKDPPESIRSYSKLIGESKVLGVEQISLTKFLDSMGYSAATASGASAGEGSGGFRPRKPPARGASGSAY